jgi:sulfur carrier protein ThiS
MKYEDLLAAAGIARRYAVAVESKLYWNMSPLQAQTEINEAERIANLLEDEASRETTEVG